MESADKTRRLGMVAMPEPDEEVLSLYSSQYGRYEEIERSPEQQKQQP